MTMETFRPGGTAPRPSKLDPFKGQIVRWLLLREPEEALGQPRFALHRFGDLNEAGLLGRQRQGIATERPSLGDDDPRLTEPVEEFGEVRHWNPRALTELSRLHPVALDFLQAGESENRVAGRLRETEHDKSSEGALDDDGSA